MPRFAYYHEKKKKRKKWLSLSRSGCCVVCVCGLRISDFGWWMFEKRTRRVSSGQAKPQNETVLMNSLNAVIVRWTFQFSPVICWAFNRVRPPTAMNHSPKGIFDFWVEHNFQPNIFQEFPAHPSAYRRDQMRVSPGNLFWLFTFSRGFPRVNLSYVNNDYYIRTDANRDECECVCVCVWVCTSIELTFRPILFLISVYWSWVPLMALWHFNDA